MDKIMRVSWALLGEWWCVDVEATKEEILEAISTAVIVPINGNRDLIADRLYGGFKCQEANRRHIHFATGQYTYLGENRPNDPENRLKYWNDLLRESPRESGYIGGIFGEDAPV